MVIAKLRCFVTEAIADIGITGSAIGHCAPVLKAGSALPLYLRLFSSAPMKSRFYRDLHIIWAKRVCQKIPDKTSFL